MPAEQRGSVYSTGKGYGIRWYDEHGARRRKAGFKSRSEARCWFENVEKRRMRGEQVRPAPVTFREHADAYVEAHKVGRDENTIRVLKERLAYATRAFGETRLDELERRVPEIAAWTSTLPARSRYGIVQALRQCLDAAVRWGHIEQNPAKLAGRNPPPKPRGVDTFTAAEVEALAVELGPTLGPMIRFAAATGMRPEEYLALERGDIDRAAGVAHVRRTVVDGRAKPYGKTGGSAREVPLSSLAIAALDDLPARLDTRLLFPGLRGGHLSLRNFRKREWHPALDAADLRPRRIYDLRSTFASEALAAGVSVFELARVMGTSVRMIERHYGTLLQGSAAAIRAKLDAYNDAAASRAAEGGTQ
jgi:integrase